MLNISLNSINGKVILDNYETWKLLKTKTVSRWLIGILAGLFVLTFLSMFLPWTQNIRSKGYVTTLNPGDRPQAVQSVIGGQISEWKVREGDHVNAGDTILVIKESKQAYFDPSLLDNTQNQITAKESSSSAYATKASNLKAQQAALVNSLDIKLKQNDIKAEQTILKIQSDSLDLVAAKTKEDIAETQLSRIQQLHDEGLKTLTDLEAKRLGVRQARAKALSIVNKINAHRNELDNLTANRTAITNEYLNKIAKSKSDRMSALSSKYDADASTSKLTSSLNAYQQRQDLYFITAPVAGLITKAIKSGIGGIIKEGEDIVTVVPDIYDLAIEMYIEPRDMPLMDIGQAVRVQFDGWPAIVFSGWPDSSYGTFAGEVYAIDNSISDNGKYRILVSPSNAEEGWPREVRVGGGANAITLLKDVSVGYELWRQLNGFPADYYKSGKSETVKSKTPLKKVK